MSHESRTEIARLQRVPRKNNEPMADVINSLVKRPEGSMELRPVQIEALWEAMAADGLLGAIAVGKGKTIIALTIPTLFPERKKPLIVTRATLIPNLRREEVRLKKHFNIRPNMTFVSYEMISQPHFSEWLDRQNFDLIVLDEAHCIARADSARSKRLTRYITEKEPLVFAMSGTLARRSIDDFYLIAFLVFGDQNCPIPVTYPVRASLSAVVDVDGRGGEYDRSNWQWMCNLTGEDTVHAAFREYLSGTRGVVVSSDSSCDADIIIHSIKDVRIPDDIAKTIAMSRKAWMDPDGFEIDSAAQMADMIRRLVSGYYYRVIWPNDTPDNVWKDARNAWSKTVRGETSKNVPGRDTELLVRRHYAAYQPNEKTFVNWMEQCHKPEPPREDVWVSEYLIDDLLQRFGKGYKNQPVIVWYNGRGIERKLKDRGVLTFGASEIPPEKPLKGERIRAMSIRAHKEGHNLQAWGVNVVLTPPPNPSDWEQLLGRTHRQGQTRDEITVFVYEHDPSFENCVDSALLQAEFSAERLGQDQKILSAYWVDR